MHEAAITERGNTKFVLNRQHWALGLSRDKTTFITTKKVPEDSVWDFPGTKKRFYYKKVPEDSVWDFPGTKKRFYYKKVPEDSGIPFKYEPEISLVGLSSTVTPDFVLYIEEIDTCIILEHLGIRSSIDYERESKLKYGNFTSAGLVIGMDFLFTHDNEVAVFDLRSLESKLNEAIYELLVCSRISITSKAPYN